MKVLLDRVKEDVKESGWPVCENTGNKYKYFVLERGLCGGNERLIFTNHLKTELLGCKFVSYGDYLGLLKGGIKDLREFRDGLLERLPYADGQAYYNDKDRIKELGEDISELKNLLSKEGV